MARRKKTDPIDDLMNIVAMLPWWPGVILAVLSYALLHAAASQPATAPAQVGQLGGVLIKTMWKTAAGIGQYIVPLICLEGAAMSAWPRRQSQTLVGDVAQSKASDALDGMR